MKKGKKILIGILIVVGTVVALGLALLILLELRPQVKTGWMIQKAEGQTADHDYEEALNTYEEILTRDPNYTEGYLASLKIYDKLGDDDDLETYYKKILKVLKDYDNTAWNRDYDIIIEIYSYIPDIYEDDEEKLVERLEEAYELTNDESFAELLEEYTAIKAEDIIALSDEFAAYMQGQIDSMIDCMDEQMTENTSEFNPDDCIYLVVAANMEYLSDEALQNLVDEGAIDSDGLTICSKYYDVLDQILRYNVMYVGYFITNEGAYETEYLIDPKMIFMNPEDSAACDDWLTESYEDYDYLSAWLNNEEVDPLFYEPMRGDPTVAQVIMKQLYSSSVMIMGEFMDVSNTVTESIQNEALLESDIINPYIKERMDQL